MKYFPRDTQNFFLQIYKARTLTWEFSNFKYFTGKLSSFFCVVFFLFIYIITYKSSNIWVKAKYKVKYSDIMLHTHSRHFYMFVVVNTRRNGGVRLKRIATICTKLFYLDKCYIVTLCHHVLQCVSCVCLYVDKREKCRKSAEIVREKFQ